MRNVSGPALVIAGVGNKSQNPRDPRYSRDWDWDLGFNFKIWDLGFIFRIWDLGFGFFLSKSRKIPKFQKIK